MVRTATDSKTKTEIDNGSFSSHPIFERSFSENKAPQCEDKNAFSFPLGSPEWARYQYPIDARISYAAKLALSSQRKEEKEATCASPALLASAATCTDPALIENLLNIIETLSKNEPLILALGNHTGQNLSLLLNSLLESLILFRNQNVETNFLPADINGLNEELINITTILAEEANPSSAPMAIETIIEDGASINSAIEKFLANQTHIDEFWKHYGVNSSPESYGRNQANWLIRNQQTIAQEGGLNEIQTQNLAKHLQNRLRFIRGTLSDRGAKAIEYLSKIEKQAQTTATAYKQAQSALATSSAAPESSAPELIEPSSETRVFTKIDDPTETQSFTKIEKPPATSTPSTTAGEPPAHGGVVTPTKPPSAPSAPTTTSAATKSIPLPLTDSTDKTMAIDLNKILFVPVSHRWWNWFPGSRSLHAYWYGPDSPYFSAPSLKVAGAQTAKVLMANVQGLERTDRMPVPSFSGEASSDVTPQVPPGEMITGEASSTTSADPLSTTTLVTRPTIEPKMANLTAIEPGTPPSVTATTVPPTTSTQATLVTKPVETTALLPKSPVTVKPPTPNIMTSSGGVLGWGLPIVGFGISAIMVYPAIQGTLNVIEDHKNGEATPVEAFSFGISSLFGVGGGIFFSGAALALKIGTRIGLFQGVRATLQNRIIFGGIGGIASALIASAAYIVYDKWSEDQRSDLMFNFIQAKINNDDKTLQKFETLTRQAKYFKKDDQGSWVPDLFGYITAVAKKSDDDTFMKLANRHPELLDLGQKKVKDFWDKNPEIQSFSDEAASTLLGPPAQRWEWSLSNFFNIAHRNLVNVGSDEFAAGLFFAQRSKNPNTIKRVENVYHHRWVAQNNDRQEYENWKHNKHLPPFLQLFEEEAGVEQSATPVSLPPPVIKPVPVTLVPSNEKDESKEKPRADVLKQEVKIVADQQPKKIEEKPTAAQLSHLYYEKGMKIRAKYLEDSRPVLLKEAQDAFKEALQQARLAGDKRFIRKIEAALNSVTL